MIYFAGYRGQSFLSKVIEARTGPIPFIIWGRYSHFSVIDLEKDLEIESWFPYGVRAGKIGAAHTEGTVVDLYAFKDPLTPDQETRLWSVLYGEIGKPYDIAGVLGFLRIARALGFHANRKAWFCSELCKYAARKVGRLLKGKAPDRTSPEDLAHETELIYIRSIMVENLVKMGEV